MGKAWGAVGEDYLHLHHTGAWGSAPGVKLREYGAKSPAPSPRQELLSLGKGLGATTASPVVYDSA